MSVTLVTSIMGRSVRTFSETPDILNEVFCFFFSPARQRTICKVKQAKNMSYEVVFLSPLPFHTIGNGFEFV
jgi:hypothetical protein